MRLASRFGLTHSIRQERPLTNDELVKVVPSVFSEEKHNSRSDRYGRCEQVPDMRSSYSSGAHPRGTS